MKRLASVLLAICLAASADDLNLRNGFANPPRRFGPETWYHWVEDCVTEEGLVRDFKAMADAGYVAAHVFSGGMNTGLPSVGKPLSPAWMRMFEIAVREARRNGLALGFHNCPGWSSSGGPWITPENSMKTVVFTETDVSPDSGRVCLPQPKARHGFYRDIAVLALPLGESTSVEAGPQTMAVTETGPTTVDFTAARPFAPRSLVFTPSDAMICFKATVEARNVAGAWQTVGEATYRNYAAVSTPKALALSGAPVRARNFRVRLQPWQTFPWDKDRTKRFLSLTLTDMPRVTDVDTRLGGGTGYVIFDPDSPAGADKDAVRDLTPHMTPDGALAWTPRSGRWRVLRIGYTTNGQVNSPATLSGLECDKLSPRGIDAHWQAMPARLLGAAGADGVVGTVIIDSYERGGQTWTEGFDTAFAQRNGYPLQPYLPVVCGYAVGHSGESARFCHDYGRVVAGLMTTNYYGRFTQLCHAAGVRSAIEPYGGPFTWENVAAQADLPMGEFWVGARAGELWSLRTHASAAHLLGRSVVPTESFTTTGASGRWRITPAELRLCGDRAWLEGVNSFVIHSYVHQPWNDRLPGVSLGDCGSHLNRLTTWWPEMRAWTDYVRRGQYLLRFGSPQAEVLVLTGESYTNLDLLNPLAAAGYDYDFTSVELLDDVARAQRYRFVHLGPDRYLTAATLKVVRRLLDGGVRIAGVRPLGSPSLADDPDAWRRLADEVYARVTPAATPLDAARAFGHRPDADSHGALRSLRRTDGRWTVQYLLNVSDKPFHGVVSFAAPVGTTAERWDAKTGTQTALDGEVTEPGRLAVPLRLRPYESAFVVLVPQGEGRARRPDPPATDVLLDLSADWAVHFDGLEAPTNRTFATLRPWGESADERLRFFSGRATYEKTFALTPTAGTRCVLDLGEVGCLAHVRLNGTDLGCVWERPFAVDVTAALADGVNTLAVDVYDTWQNRLIGDARRRRLGQKAATWTSWLGAWQPDETLARTGLLGPVRLKASCPRRTAPPPQPLPTP